MFERSHPVKLPFPRPVTASSDVLLSGSRSAGGIIAALTLTGLFTCLFSIAAAQTAPVQTAPAPAAPAPAQPAPAQTTPAQTAPATPAPVAPVVAPRNAAPLTLPGSSNVASALGIEVSATVKGRLINCPKTLKVSGGAVCLYTQNTLPVLRSLLRGKFSGRIVSDWKTGAGEKSASLLVKAGSQNAYVLLAQLSPTETLVVVDGVPQAQATTATLARPAMPAGIVKGERYVLDSDLKGLVNVAGVGNGVYRMASVSGGPVLSVTSGKKIATLGAGSVELTLPPVSDGKNLLFPLDGLRALGCTLAPAQVGVTVACGSSSANIRPIVF
ncbi:hypothetical protein [Deinococcus sp.]|uniref:hypothetical protein n=1 Tax=Deinococcus sp. TaxID=47478 RepID=UPI003C7E630C